MIKLSSSKFRKKRADTKIGTIEKQYGRDFGVRSDKEMGLYLKQRGYGSLTQLFGNG